MFYRTHRVHTYVLNGHKRVFPIPFYSVFLCPTVLSDSLNPQSLNRGCCKPNRIPAECSSAKRKTNPCQWMWTVVPVVFCSSVARLNGINIFFPHCDSFTFGAFLCWLFFILSFILPLSVIDKSTQNSVKYVGTECYMFLFRTWQNVKFLQKLYNDCVRNIKQISVISSENKAWLNPVYEQSTLYNISHINRK